MRRLVAAQLGVGAALVAVAAAWPSSTAGTTAYFVAAALSAAAVVLGLRGRPPSRVWSLARAGIVAFVAGAVVEQVLQGGVLPEGSAYALVSLPAYVLVAATVLALARASGPAHKALTDTALVAVAFVSFLWPVVMEPNVKELPGAGPTIALVFIAADLVLLALLARAAFSSLADVPAFRFLAGSLTVLFASDILANATAAGSAATTHAVAGCYALAYTLAGAAALHPSVPEVVAPRAEHEPSTARTLALVVGSLLGVPAGAVLDRWLDGELESTIFLVLGLIAVLLVALRLGLVLRRLELLRARAQASEERFRMVFESAGLGISIGVGGVMSETNAAYRRMVGYTGEELAQMHFREITHPDDVELDERESARVMSGRLPVHRFEKRYVRRDGTIVPAEVTLTAAPDLSFGIALVEDIRPRRALEEELHRAQRLEAIGKLAGGIAHDFNNLLTVISGYTNLLQGELEPGERHRAEIDAISQAAARAAELTRALLAFSRRQVLRPEPIELADVVVGLETLLRSLLPENVTLAVEAQPGVFALVDRAQLEQVVLNLALNARDAMPDGGTLTIRVQRGDGIAELEVADEGVGMDEETRNRAFEPFFTTKPVGAGTGLGLATVEGIVAQSGGEVRLESIPGFGSVFTVRFPLAAPDAVAEAVAGPPAESGRGLVLLAEDEWLVRRVTAAMLRRRGYEVVESASGEEALQLLVDGLVPDALVSDVVMTGIGGPELAQQARELLPALPVLLVSGYAAPVVGERGVGEEELLAKPFTADELAAAVESVRSRAAAVSGAS